MEKNKKVRKRLQLILFILLSALFVIAGAALWIDYSDYAHEDNQFKELAHIVSDIDSPSSSTSANMGIESEPTADEEGMLPQYASLYARNADMAGWVVVDGTTINYPVMYSVDEDNFYLSHDFDRNKSRSGVPFIDGRCSLDPVSTNTIIYGHHMKNGTMFTPLTKFEDEAFYRQHQMIRFDTLYEQHEYEIISVFESYIFQKSEDAYRHYDFINATGKEEFDEFIGVINKRALYDTGKTAAYGDELLTLITCEYHADYGQLVVVAKKVS